MCNCERREKEEGEDGEVYLARSFASTNGEQIIGLDRERYFYSLVTRFLLSVYVSSKFRYRLYTPVRLRLSNLRCSSGETERKCLRLQYFPAFSIVKIFMRLHYDHLYRCLYRFLYRNLK